MTYNKAKEEWKWRTWKEMEEKKMRQLGVSEEIIKQLRIHDWDVFNSERRYYEKIQGTNTYVDTATDEESNPEIRSIDDFLNSIESEKLYQVLASVDNLTLQIAVLRIQGFSTKEVALKLGITPKSIYRRIDRLKEKIKKFK